MATSSIHPFSAIDEAPARPSARASSRLEDAEAGARVVVVELALEADLRAWLEAVGINVGEELVVLRRGAFGGPLHVRTGSGGEFALNVALARSVLVAPPGSAPHGAGDSAA